MCYFVGLSRRMGRQCRMHPLLYPEIPRHCSSCLGISGYRSGCILMSPPPLFLSSWRVRPSPWRSSPRTQSTWSSPKSRTRKASPLTSSALFLLVCDTNVIPTFVGCTVTHTHSLRCTYFPSLAALLFFNLHLHPLTSTHTHAHTRIRMHTRTYNFVYFMRLGAWHVGCLCCVRVSFPFHRQTAWGRTHSSWLQHPKGVYSSFGSPVYMCVCMCVYV